MIWYYADENSVLFLYEKSFIDHQACSVKMAGYWPFFACLWTSTQY